MHGHIFCEVLHEVATKTVQIIIIPIELFGLLCLSAMPLCIGSVNGLGRVYVIKPLPIPHREGGGREMGHTIDMYIMQM